MKLPTVAILLLLFDTCRAAAVKPRSVHDYTKSLSVGSAMNCALLLSTVTVATASDNPLINDIRSNYPYITPSDILPYIYDNSKQGDFDSVVKAMDVFASAYPMYKLSPEKVALLVQQVKQWKPTRVLEIGSFFGYSALHFLKYIPNYSTLTLIEGNEDNINVLKKIIEYTFGSGIEDKYKVLNGISSDILNSASVREKLLWSSNSNQDNGFDFVFLDHEKSYYLKDTLLLRSKGLLSTSRCQLLADNVIYPGAPDYLEYMNANTKTVIKYLPFERKGFETQFKEHQDGMSISILM